ncbi:MAG: YgiQ family radical SAM protein [Elusimicrobiales bacterium]|nr:YgiQ family radical SAM protein [Elusimicrobiales bacterium]
MDYFIPVTVAEIKKLGWDRPDIVLVSGDAFVDHPSFAMAVLGRVLQANGFRVAVLAQPAWENCTDFRKFGRPRLFFGVSAGNMDSMINKYTHNRKIRSEDAFTPGGRPGRRPDRATIIYSQRCREAYPDVPLVIGGIEATMRRFAHYDYWSDKVRKSILLDSKADLLMYGMGEKNIVELAKRLDAGEDIKHIRNMRGTMYPLGAKETASLNMPDAVILPSAGEVAGDRRKFSEATREIYLNYNPYCSKVLVQKSDGKAVVQNPPSLPLTTEEMDAIYDLPYTKRAHPSYKEPVPALETVKDSIIIHRGCFGGCSFCSLTLHQGHFIQTRSQASILKEAEALLNTPRHKGYISDLGAPSANMYDMHGRKKEVCKICRRLSCLCPEICPNLNTDFTALLKLMRKVSTLPNLRRVFIASGIRMDLSLCCGEYIREIAAKHTSGQLKVAPEHISPEVLKIMNKPPVKVLDEFTEKFKDASRKAGKEQYLVHYFISAHPGSTLKNTAELALYLKEHNIRPQQINDFLPAPMELSTSIYYTGLDPFTMEPVYVPKKELERKMQRALIQYFKPENRGLVIRALNEIGRPDLIRKILG